MKPFFIDYFTNEQSFIELQIDFLKEDFRYQMNPEYFPKFEKILIKEEFSIEDQVPLPHKEDPNGFSYDLQKRFFYKDFLPSIIKKLSSNFLEDFYNYIREDLLESQKERHKFLNEQKKFIANIFDNINQFDFIEFSLFTELKSQLLQIEIAVSSPTLYNDKYLKNDKLALHSWNETDLVTFFHFLRTHKVIDFISDGELGRFLERNFCVENDDGEVLSLDSLNKRLNDLKNTNKLNDRSEKRLSDLFKKISKY
ncbi:hypothetical protein H1R17_12785 [Flavobacterium sp. xlx-214]|uniref:hypothetical protein n=1 Tax=unclassified Flavobacterium TaxID=196869 RepID=UPI0013D39352|nr:MULTISPECIES: hypothetical protein [unclassified Flavobacterium]MBA5791533.1 hypothetical protein [Flavobacterium sp. xlx-221]QMI83317.1 hypothetical protein H1R17_12785 [Flavobacterium sp. xlx-214]